MLEECSRKAHLEGRGHPARDEGEPVEAGEELRLAQPLAVEAQLRLVLKQSLREGRGSSEKAREGQTSQGEHCS